MDGFATQVNIFKDNGIPGLREMFKRSFSSTNGLLTKQSEVFDKHNIENIFEFSWFYDQKIFCENVKGLLVNLGYEYKVDTLHHQQEFLDRKQRFCFFVLSICNFCLFKFYVIHALFVVFCI